MGTMRQYQARLGELAVADRKATQSATSFADAVLLAHEAKFNEWLQDAHLDVNAGIMGVPTRDVSPIEVLFSTYGPGATVRGRHSYHWPSFEEWQDEPEDVHDGGYRTDAEKEEVRRAVEPMMIALVRHPRFLVTTRCVWSPSRCLLAHAVLYRLPSVFEELLWLGAAHVPLAPGVRSIRDDLVLDASLPAETAVACLGLLREHDQKGVMAGETLVDVGLSLPLVHVICAYVGLRACKPA